MSPWRPDLAPDARGYLLRVTFLLPSALLLAWWGMRFLLPVLEVPAEAVLSWLLPVRAITAQGDVGWWVSTFIPMHDPAGPARMKFIIGQDKLARYLLGLPIFLALWFSLPKEVRRLEELVEGLLLAMLFFLLALVLHAKLLLAIAAAGVPNPLFPDFLRYELAHIKVVVEPMGDLSYRLLGLILYMVINWLTVLWSPFFFALAYWRTLVQWFGVAK